MSSSSARIEEVPEEEDDAAYMVEVDQVYLIHQSNYVRAKCENGSIVLPKESFVENSPVYSIRVERPVVSQDPAPDPLARTITLDVLLSDGKDKVGFVGPVASTTEYPTNTVNIYASAIGAEYKGDLGKRLNYIDTLKKEEGGGLARATHGRWGLNVSCMPAGSKVILRFGPFPPADGEVLLKIKSWCLLERKADKTWSQIPSPVQPQQQA